MTHDNIFKIVHKTNSIGKNKIDMVQIETSTKGLIYRTEVYIEDNLVDAKEVSCQDLATSEVNEIIFKKRYTATHEKYEELYFAPRVFIKVLEDEGLYLEDENEKCIISTSVYNNIVRHEVSVGLENIDKIEHTIEKDIANNKAAFTNKYKQLHQEVVDKYVKILKFPANTFLNPIIKKFPLYNKNPLYAFYLFLITVAFVLWIVSLILCGKALVKITKKVAGKEAGLVVKDLQKSMCIKSYLDKEKLKPEVVLEKEDVVAKYGSAYLILPEQIEFKSTKDIKSIYIKNNLQTGIIVKLRERLITDFENPLVTPDMIVNILTPLTINIKAEGVGMYEFKIEEEFLKNSSLAGQSFKGNLVFDIIDIKEKTSKPQVVEFNFVSDAASELKE
jgi:hypothetical protein